ncbi:MAG: hypothetical protein ABI068_11415 [Ktedonobacterales bacterium]
MSAAPTATNDPLRPTPIQRARDGGAIAADDRRDHHQRRNWPDRDATQREDQHGDAIDGARRAVLGTFMTWMSVMPIILRLASIRMPMPPPK